jgi:hypothetical protein
MRTARMIRRGLPGLALAVAACGGAPTTEETTVRTAPPPPVIEPAQRDRPVFHLPDAEGPNSYYVYLTPKGRTVMTVEPGIGLRPATEAEARFALARYAAQAALPRAAQPDAYAALLRAERAAKRDYSDELVAMMRDTIRRWGEEKRGLEIKQEAARAAGAKEQEAQLGLMIADLDRRLLAHEIKVELYTSPEWKAARPVPKSDNIPVPAVGAK